jgi:hypothetical protein
VPRIRTVSCAEAGKARPIKARLNAAKVRDTRVRDIMPDMDVLLEFDGRVRLTADVF